MGPWGLGACVKLMQFFQFFDNFDAVMEVSVKEAFQRFFKISLGHF